MEEKIIIDKLFVEELSKHNISINDKQLEFFNKYFNLLVSENGKVNLTSITDRKEVYIKHFLDSISLSFYEPKILNNEKINIVDVGAGAGFPSIPLKIMFPNLKITIIDSLNKRIKFLDQLIEELDLKDVLAVHERAEIAGKDNKFRNKFDISTARALASMPILLEFLSPLTKKSGKIWLYKSQKATNEISDSKNAINKLSLRLDNNFSFKLLDENTRNLVEFTKISDLSKKYPRKMSDIKNKTL